MSTAQLLPNVYQTWQNSNGVVLAGGKLYSYVAGTTTPQATYTDETAATPNTNPVVLNSAGQASVWLRTDLSYKLALYDSSANLIWTADNVNVVNPGSIDRTKIAANVAGIGLAQDADGALDVQVDNVTVQVSGSNQLEVVPDSLTPNEFSSQYKLEVLFRKVRDLNCSGIIEQIPQYEWTSPSALSTINTQPEGAAACVRWSPNGEFLAVGNNTANYLDFYQLSANANPNNNPILTKLGAESGNPVPFQISNAGVVSNAYPEGAILSLTWSPCGDFLAILNKHAATCVTIFKRIGNNFQVLPLPATLPFTGVEVPSSGQIAFSPNGDFLLVVAHSGSDNSLICYLRGGALNAYSQMPNGGSAAVSITVTGNGTYNDSAPLSGFPQQFVNFNMEGCLFTDITNDSGLTGFGAPIAWSKDSSLVAGVDLTTHEIDVYQREDYVFSGITPPNVSSYAGDITGMAFSPDGNFLAVIVSVTPYILIFTITDGVFAQLSNPGTIPTAAPTFVNWSENSEYLIVGQGATSPYLTIYQVANPTSSPTFTAQTSMASVIASGSTIVDGDFCSTKQFLALASSTDTYLQAFKTSSILASNGFLWLREAPNV